MPGQHVLIVQVRDRLCCHKKICRAFEKPNWKQQVETYELLVYGVGPGEEKVYGGCIL